MKRINKKLRTVNEHEALEIVTKGYKSHKIRRNLLALTTLGIGLSALVLSESSPTKRNILASLAGITGSLTAVSCGAMIYTNPKKYHKNPSAFMKEVYGCKIRKEHVLVNDNWLYLLR